MAETDTPADSPAEGSVQGTPPKKSRAGRNLPAAIAVGAAIGFTIIAILIWNRYLWVVLVAVAMPVATHEVVRRLREAGYVIPFIPLLVGGQLMIWLTWHFHAVGALAGYGVTAVVCVFWRLALQEPPAGDGAEAPQSNYLRDVAATVFLAAWVPLFGAFGVLLVYPTDGSLRVFCLMIGVVFSDSRRLFRRRALRKASDGAVDQPEQIVGGAGGFAVLRDHRGHIVRDPAGPQAGLDRPAARPDDCGHRDPRATWWNRRSSVTWASRTWAASCPVTVA